MSDLITREQKVTESVERWAKAGLTARGYPMAKIEWRDSFPQEATTLTKDTIAAGFDFDDPGDAAELGSTLMRRPYTVQFWTFGMNATSARQLAHALKFAIEREGTIPLLDIAEDDNPVIDYLEVDQVSADQQLAPDPEPWQEHVWTTTARVIDLYYAGQV